MLSQLDIFVRHGIGNCVESKKEVVLVVAKKSDILQNENVVCLCIDYALMPYGIETDWFMVGDAVAECFDLLEFFEDGFLSETLLAD